MDLFRSPFRLRPFQADFDNLCKRVAAGADIRRCLGLCTPGSGKSALPVIAAARLIPSLADALCWVVPRRSLQTQAEEAFGKPELRRVLSHRLEIRVSTNEPKPSRDKAGFVTTVQALTCDSLSLALQEFHLRRYILILDEFHHVWTGSSSERCIAPLIEAARFVLFMTGSGSRHDGRRIAFMPYFLTDEGEKLDVRESPSWSVVRCDRKQALSDRSIIRLQFFLCDSKAEWTNRAGVKRSVESFEGASNDDELSEALHTALNTTYAFQLLDQTLAHWSDWRQRVNPGARLLVVAANIPSAKIYLSHLKDRGLHAKIATCDDSKDALVSIKQFKEGHVDVLVTVAMAYEGLDVPSITHIACLTHIRSYPWIEQMIGRATRFDPDAGDWESQFAFIYAPDDPLMREILHKINKEQLESLTASAGRESSDIPGPGSDRPGGSLPSIVPHDSEMHNPRITGLDGGDVPPEWAGRIVEAKRELGLAASDLQLYQFLCRLQPLMSPTGPAIASATVPLYVLPSEREKQLRQRIQKQCNVLDVVRKVDHGTTNREILEQFGKSRTEMGEAELAKVWAWLNATYGGQTQ